MLDQKVSGTKGDHNKVYFLIIVIAALIGTNAYLYIKDRQESERFVTVSNEKDRLKLEVEKIEVELDKVNAINLSLTNKLLEEQGLARQKIAELKSALQKGRFNKDELLKAQKEIKELHEFVKTYNEDINRLQQENFLLKSERDSLAKSSNKASERANALARRNSELNDKVKTGAILKAFNVGVTAYKVKNSGKHIEVTSASSAKKLVVSFGIAPNPLARKDYHKIYLRVFDPAGNLIADESNMFDAESQQMQYSEMITISYNDDNTAYSIQWVNPKEFIKGTYTVILYADGHTMGKSSIMLK